MTKQLELWQGQFGDDYTARNVITDENLKAREILWAQLLQFIMLNSNEVPKTILEVGCGAGINLLAIENVYKNNGGKEVELFGFEPNKKAARIASQQDIRQKTISNTSIFNTVGSNLLLNHFDIVFTSGVLIHIHPDDLLKATKEIYRLSNKFIVCLEYFSPELREIKYREQDKALWLQDFGSHYLNSFPLRCIGFGFAWKKMTGIDNLHWQILQKTH